MPLKKAVRARAEQDIKEYEGEIKLLKAEIEQRVDRLRYNKATVKKLKKLIKG